MQKVNKHAYIVFYYDCEENANKFNQLSIKCMNIIIQTQPPPTQIHRYLSIWFRYLFPFSNVVSAWVKCQCR